ncbi:MAG: hypothetical protein QOJ51_1689 [Acidobacteriaceae bacterium]|nr:hypothetical protein [Acidobacteriaceae bacterium]
MFDGAKPRDLQFHSTGASNAEEKQKITDPKAPS